MATFSIVNKRTGAVVGNANTIGGARKSVDRNDNKYGGYAHVIRENATGKIRMARNQKTQPKKSPRKAK